MRHTYVNTHAMVMQLWLGCLKLKDLTGRRARGYSAGQGSDAGQRVCCPVCRVGPRTPDVAVLVVSAAQG